MQDLTNTIQNNKQVLIYQSNVTPITILMDIVCKII